MLPTIRAIKDRLEFLRTNPNAIQRYSLELLEEISEEDYTIASPSNPFIFLLENSAILASLGMDESRSRVRELYPSLANKPEDIYRHMSDVDYLNQFSIPGRVVISLIFNSNEIKNLAVQVPNQNYKKVTIPKNSVFSISEYDFGIHYPVDLRVNIYDEIQVAL